MRHRFCFAVLLVFAALAPAAAQDPSVTLPAVTGPIPVTAGSYPLMASNTLQIVVAQIFPRWNPLTSWLGQIEPFRKSLRHFTKRRLSLLPAYFLEDKRTPIR